MHRRAMWPWFGRAAVCAVVAGSAWGSASAAAGILHDPVELQLTGAMSAMFAAQPAPDAPPAGAADQSGTDPTLFLRTVRLTNETIRTTSESWSNITAASYVQPFADARMNFRLKVPAVWTDAGGDGEFGLGDISLRYNWLASVTQAYGLLVGAEVVGDTASEDVLGRGKWTVGPLVTYAMFLNKNVIFAPTYQHNFSFAGDSDRADVNESVIDLYMVFTADDKKSWFIIDPTIVVDWENEENVPVTVELEYGWNAGALWGGALNAFIRPGIGIGQDRPYEWNVEFGFALVGF